MLVTLITGFLGSGKTTLLRRLLREVGPLKLGVIVNDMSPLEVDGDLIRGGKRVSEAAGTLVSLASGSISGSQQQAFEQVLDAWAERTDLDHVIIETSGSAHPWPLVEAISRRPAYTLSQLVTLLDARTMTEDYGAGLGLMDRRAHHEEQGQRGLENLLAEQIQWASTLLLTKTDRVTERNLDSVLECLRKLNPEAAVHRVIHGQISPSLLLGSASFDLRRAQEMSHARWGQGLVGVGEAAAYDLSSTVVCDARPLHPQRLWDLFHHQLGAGIHRSKGFLWMASRDEQVLLWNQAAGGLGLELLAYWKAAIVKDPLGKLLPEEIAHLEQQLSALDPRFGDRLNEITVIGTQKHREYFVGQLQTCFCTEAEIQHWQQGGRFQDPWPQALKARG